MMRRFLIAMVLLTATSSSVFGQENASRNAPNAADESAIRALNTPIQRQGGQAPKP